MQVNFYSLKKTLSSLVLLLMCLAASAQQQGSLSGTVLDQAGQPLPGATVVLKEINKGVLADRNGRYQLDQVPAGSYTLQASFVGYSTVSQPVTVAAGEQAVNLTLAEDALAMDEIIVTGTFDPRTKLESSVAITTLNAVSIQQRAPRGTGDLLQSVPGIWADNSSGEVGSKVVARGLAPVGNDQVGFQYVSLQEEGLPVIGSQMGFAAVDMFQRADITTARMEAIRGGSSSITSANSPGGIFNFISKTGGTAFAGSARLTGGVYSNGKGLGRFDGEFGGPIAKGWAYHAGGFYRLDGGARNTPFNANQGGQVKANLSKTFANGRGLFKLYGKYLDDRNTFFKDIALNQSLTAGYDNGLGDPVDINHSTTFIDVTAQVPLTDQIRPDNLGNPPKRTFNAGNGIHNVSRALGLDFSYDLGKGWGLGVRAKSSAFVQDYLQYQGNSVLPVLPSVVGSADLGPQQGYLQFGAGALASPSTYAAGLQAIPEPTRGAIAGAVATSFVPSVLSPTYYDVQTGEVLARAQFTLANGAPASVLAPGTSNRLGNYILATAPLNMFNRINDNIAQVNVTKEVGGHQLTLGTYLARTAISTRWFVDAVLSTLGGNPRAIRADFPAPATAPAIVAGNAQLNAAFGPLYSPTNRYNATDPNGLVLQSGLAYTVTENVSNLRAFYLNDVWKVNDRLSIDLGARFESVRHTGTKQGWRGGTAVGGLGGLDRNPYTTYDLGTRLYNGDVFTYDASYQTTSPTASTLARDANGRFIVSNADANNDGEGFLYQYLSWSAGGNYKLTERTAAYLRVSRGNKAPELDYYANNFVNIPLDKKAPVETVTQAEAGFKLSSRRTSFTATAFYSYLDNALLQLFISNGAESFFTDATFNASRTTGLELELVLNPTDRFNIRTHATLQDARYARLTYQNTAGGSTNRNDFFNESFAGNRVKDVAPVMVDITPTYRIGKFSPYLNYRWFSERQANRRNSVQLAPYGVLGAGVTCEPVSRLTLAVQASNLLNSAGIMTFGGYGLQGTSAEDIAVGGVRKPDGTILRGSDVNKLNALGSPVFARPVLARQLTASATYRF